MTKSSELAD